MRRILCLLVIILLNCQKSPSDKTVIEAEPIAKPNVDFEKLKSKAVQALAFVEAKDYNNNFCILVDMSLHSGVNRFFHLGF